VALLGAASQGWALRDLRPQLVRAASWWSASRGSAPRPSGNAPTRRSTSSSRRSPTPASRGQVLAARQPRGAAAPLRDREARRSRASRSAPRTGAPRQVAAVPRGRLRHAPKDLDALRPLDDRRGRRQAPRRVKVVRTVVKALEERLPANAEPRRRAITVRPAGFHISRDVAPTSASGSGRSLASTARLDGKTLPFWPSGGPGMRKNDSAISGQRVILIARRDRPRDGGRLSHRGVRPVLRQPRRHQLSRLPR